MIPLSSSISAAAQKVRSYRQTFNFQDIVTTAGILAGIVVAIYTLTLPKPRATTESWQALNPTQIAALGELVKANPGKRVLIERTSLPETISMADTLAGIFQQNGWSLLSPPFYPPLSGDYFGLNVLASLSNGVANALSDTLQRQLHVDVYRDEQPANMLGPDRKPVDIVVAIGMKHKPSLLLGGTETVKPSSTEMTVKLQRGSLPYDVSSTTDWNSVVTVIEKTGDHFTVRFATPAPAGSNQKVHWLAFRYP
jgi:hypothetical protein